MKKRYLVFIFICTLLVMCACTGEKADESSYRKYPLTASGIVTVDDFGCAVDLTMSRKDHAEITVNSPENLKGYKFEVDNGSVSVYYDGIRIPVGSDIACNGVALLSDMFSFDDSKVKDVIKGEDNKCTVYKTEKAEYRVYTPNNKSEPNRIEAKYEGHKVVFEINSLIVQK